MTVIIKSTFSHSQATGEDANGLTINTQVFDIAKNPLIGSGVDGALVVGDKILFAVIPAGEVVVNHLSTLSVPALADGGDYTTGTKDAPTVLDATQACETPLSLSAFPAGTFGSRDAETPLYITIETLTGLNTPASTGKIVTNLVTRPWDSRIDV